MFIFGQSDISCIRDQIKIVLLDGEKKQTFVIFIAISAFLGIVSLEEVQEIPNYDA